MSKGRYVVKWDEKTKDVFGDCNWYNHHEEEFINKKDAVELFDWLSDCEKEGLARNVSLYDKARNKIISKETE